MHVTKEEIAAGRRALLARPRWANREPKLDFKVRPISEEWRHTWRTPAYRTAVCNAAYIVRDDGPIDRFGPMPSSFAERRCELQAGGLALPANAPRWAEEPYRIWEEADAATVATGDPTAVAAWHAIMQIPDGCPAALRPWLVREFIQRHLVSRGAPVAWAIHVIAGCDQPWIVPPHAHLVVAARSYRHDARHGQRHPAWIASWAAQQRLGMAWQHWAKAAAL